MVEYETGLKIKKLRTDNGGKYEDTSFKQLYIHNWKYNGLLDIVVIEDCCFVHYRS